MCPTMILHIDILPVCMHLLRLFLLLLWVHTRQKCVIKKFSLGGDGGRKAEYTKAMLSSVLGAPYFLVGAVFLSRIFQTLLADNYSAQRTLYRVLSPVSRLHSHVSCHTSSVSRLLCHVSCLTSPVSCLVSHVSCVTSLVSPLWSHVSCLTSSVSCLPSPVSCLMSPVSHLLSHIAGFLSPVSGLLSFISCLLSPVSYLLSHINCITFSVS